MTEKKLKELLDKLDINHPMANVVRNILNQYVLMKQTKLTINSLCIQFKINDLYKEIVENSTDNN